MGNKTEANNVNEKVTLTVFRSSPHIWAGGLEGKDLAFWLIGKANALMNLDQHQQAIKHHVNALETLQLSERLVTTYATLGLSLQEMGPIQPLSMEAIQFDMDHAATPHILGTTEQNRVKPVPPVGFGQLPDLCEAQEEFQQRKAALSPGESNQCEQKQND